MKTKNHEIPEVKGNNEHFHLFIDSKKQELFFWIV